MPGRQLRRILHAHDALLTGYGTQRGGQQRRLACAGAARDQEGQPRSDDLLEQSERFGSDGARADERVEVLGGGPQHPQ